MPSDERFDHKYSIGDKVISKEGVTWEVINIWYDVVDKILYYKMRGHDILGVVDKEVGNVDNTWEGLKEDK